MYSWIIERLLFCSFVNGLANSGQPSVSNRARVRRPTNQKAKETANDRHVLFSVSILPGFGKRMKTTSERLAFPPQCR
jgi:hypothetical protein